jgi:hypothetical protein
MKNNEKKLYANRTQGYEMMINNDKKRPKMKKLSSTTNWLMTEVH